MLGIGLVFFSLYVDSNDKDEMSHVFVNMVLSVGLTVLTVLLMFLSSYWKNPQLVNLAGRASMFTIALTMSLYFSFCLQFPNIKKAKSISFLRIILTCLSFYFILQVHQYNFSMEDGIVVKSSVSPFGNTTWYELFIMFYVKLLPVAGMIALLKTIVSKQIELLRKQQAVVIVCGSLFLFIFYNLFNIAKNYVPVYSSLYPVAMTVMILLLFFAIRISVVVDPVLVMRTFVHHMLTHVLTALLVGIIFALLLPLRATNLFAFWFFFVSSSLVCFVIGKYISMKLRNTKFSRSSDYEEILENAFVAIDYNESSDMLIDKFTSLLIEHTETSNVEFLLDDDKGSIKSIVAYNGRPSKTIKSRDAVIDFLAGVKNPVVFRNQVASKHEYSSYRKALFELFDNLNADVLILLRESHHLFGLITLGPRKRENEFTDYDYKVLSNLYSYFFLFGFYMKNIANESLVGTVDREIQFSSQIIRSIQENVDLIKNPEVDVGYLSRSARSLGGDFIDFIRLTDTRYIMIMGDVSGKGLNASMSMVILKSIIRTLLTETSDFKELVEKVNHFIKFNLPRGTFFAGVFTLFDFNDNMMYYVNCGLPVLFLYTESYKNVIEIQGEGKVLGFVKKISNIVKVKKIKLNKGDIVLACTDGLLDSESLRGEMYGKDRVQKLILDNKTFDSTRLVQFLVDDMLEFTSKDLQDDVTAVAIKMLDKQ